MVINNNYIELSNRQTEISSKNNNGKNIETKEENEIAIENSTNHNNSISSSDSSERQDNHRNNLQIVNKLKELNDKNIAEVEFQGSRKEIYFNPLVGRIKVDDWVIVETENGLDLGKISKLGGKLYSWWKHNYSQDSNLVVNSIKFKASIKDLEKYQANLKEQTKIVEEAKQLVKTHNLDMRITEAEWQFDKHRLTIFFLAPQRVDFRELVKDLAKQYKTRIELRQITHRERAKRITQWVGVCGRPICCGCFLQQVKPISIEHSKVQQLSANVTKLSGYCGRLKCCLMFEYDFYLEESKRFPKLGSKLDLEDGSYLLIKFDIFKNSLTFVNEAHHNFRTFTLEEIQAFAAQNKVLEPKENGCSFCDKFHEQDNLDELIELAD